MSDPEGTAAALAKYTVKNFVATTAEGEVVRDRAVLSSLPPPAPSRLTGLRNQDDAVVIYDDTALYTFKAKRAAAAAGNIARSAAAVHAVPGPITRVVADRLPRMFSKYGSD